MSAAFAEAMPAGLHVATSGMFCVPTAIEIITGRDPQSVIFPAMNRHTRKDELLQEVAGAHMCTARSVLEELGYRSRPLNFRDDYTRLRATSDGAFAIETRHPQGWPNPERNRVVAFARKLLHQSD